MAEPTEPLTDKKFSLKVSIHCEACKKKVVKVLKSVEGVLNVNVDSKLQKVEVIGNVHPEIAIKKLIKSNKNAELWPEPEIVDDPKKKKNQKSKQKDKQIDPDEEGAAKNGPDTQNEAVKVEDTARSGESGSSPAKISEGGGGGGGQAAESKSEGKKPETGSAGGQSPAAVDKKDGVMKTDDGGKKSNGSDGNGGKKKKKKGQESRAEGGPSGAGVPAGTISATPPNHYTGPHPVNLSPPRHHAYQYPQHYYEPPPHFHTPPPAYVGNYHTAYPTSSHTTTYHPTNSYTASYYAAPPPQPHSYAYRYPGVDPEMPPSDSSSYPPRQPLDSFELFSDENPNGCSIM